MDIDLITELLKPFLSAITHNIHDLSCDDISGADLPCDDLSRDEPGPTGSRDRQGPATLSNEQLTSISTYIDLLIRWNSRINLTAIRDPEQIVTRHFGESLFAARHLFPNDRSAVRSSEATSIASAATARVAPARVVRARVVPGLGPGDPSHPTEDSITPIPHHLLDIGSGPGFPALPIKIWAPQIQLTLVESNQKKATFLREVSRALTLTNVNVLNSRAEDLPAAAADTVTIRAVERFHSILPVALRLTRPGGRIALLIGESQVGSAKAAVSIKWSHPLPIPQSTARVLLMGNA